MKVNRRVTGLYAPVMRRPGHKSGQKGVQNGKQNERRSDLQNGKARSYEISDC